MKTRYLIFLLCCLYLSLSFPETSTAFEPPEIPDEYHGYIYIPGDADGWGEEQLRFFYSTITDIWKAHGYEWRDCALFLCFV